MRFGSRGPSRSSRILGYITYINALTEKAWEDAVQGLGNRESKLHVYGKRQTADSSRKFLKIENEQIKTAHNNSYNSNFRCRNNEQQNTIKEETWSRGTNSRLRLTLVNMMLNLSDLMFTLYRIAFAPRRRSYLIARASVHTQTFLPLPDASQARTVQQDIFSDRIKVKIMATAITFNSHLCSLVFLRKTR